MRENLKGMFISDVGEIMFISDVGEIMFISDVGEIMFISDVGEIMFISDVGEMMFISDVGENMFSSDVGEIMFISDVGENMFSSDVGEIVGHCAQFNHLVLVAPDLEGNSQGCANGRSCRWNFAPQWMCTRCRSRKTTAESPIDLLA